MQSSSKQKQSKNNNETTKHPRAESAALAEVADKMKQLGVASSTPGIDGNTGAVDSLRPPGSATGGSLMEGATSATTAPSVARSNDAERRVTFDAATLQMIRELEERARRAEQRTEEERKAKEEERKAKEEERKAKEEERKAKLEERQGRQKAEASLAQAEASLAQSYRPVRECIHGAPMTTVPFKPQWGEPLLEGESNKSTATSKNWLEVRGEHVSNWPDAELLEWIRTRCERNIIVQDREVNPLQLILEGRVDASVQAILRGATGEALAGRRAKDENVVEDILVKSTWTGIEQSMGGFLGQPRDEKRPASDFMRTTVYIGKEGTVSRVPPQYKEMYKLDRIIECVFDAARPEFQLDEKSVEAALPYFEAPSRANERELANLASRLNVEIKVPALCPKRKLEDERDPNLARKNAAISGDLAGYMQDKVAFDPSCNPVAQLVTYNCVSRTRASIIHSANHFTLCFIDVNDDGTVHVWLSKKFDCTSGAPQLGEWGVWEILIRFILASRGEWYIHRFPDALKEIFRKKREDFLRRSSVGSDSKRSRQSEDEGGAGGGDEGGGNGGGGEGGQGDGGGNAGRGGRGRRSGGSGARSSSTGKTTGGSRRSGGNVDEGGELEKVKESTSDREFLLDRFSYADLWSPIRFAVPPTHPIEVECSEARLEGDPEVIGRGRCGPVYRKTLQNRDAAVKVMPYCTAPYTCDGPDAWELRGEMRREFDVYRRLESLQGRVIPRLLWYGELVEGAADALATEYCGERFPSGAARAQKARALRALRELHAKGVLHGDVALRNFTCRGEDEVFMLDFGFSRFKEEVEEGGEDWEAETAKEIEALKRELGWRDVEEEVVVDAGKTAISLSYSAAGTKRRFCEVEGE